MVIRHCNKGNGASIFDDPENGGSKDLLSPLGEKQSTNLILPNNMKPVKYVGGSEFSRSLMTALKIANGNGSDPMILPSNPALGSRKGFQWFYDNMDAYSAEAKATNEMLALKKLAPEDFVKSLRRGIDVAVRDTWDMNQNTILGTHAPYLQLLIEAMINESFDYDVATGSYIIIDDKMMISDTNIRELCKILGIPFRFS